MAITAGKGLGGGAASAGAAAGESAAASVGTSAGVSAITLAGVATVAGLGLAFATGGVLLGLVAGAACTGGGAGALKVTIIGPAARLCSIGSGSNGTGSALLVGFASMSGGSVSTARSSGTSTRRSCQGRAKPGSPNSWLPNCRLNNRAWMNSEISSGIERRRPSELMRRTASLEYAGKGSDGCSGAGAESGEFKSVPSARQFYQMRKSGPLQRSLGRGLPWVAVAL